MTIPQALVKLSRSKFRGRFKLNDAMKAYVMEKGEDEIRAFAVQRIANCLAAAEPQNDGKQTPLKGHPVFLAQHATAMCCRTCMNHWWRVPKGVEMSPAQQTKAVNLMMAWIEMQMKGGVEELIKTMSPEEIETIPFYSHEGSRFECPYRTAAQRRVVGQDRLTSINSPTESK